MKFMKKIVWATCFMMIFSTITAFAFTSGQTLMSYQGTGIRTKSAVGAFAFANAGNSVKINHTNTKIYNGGPGAMSISLTKKYWNGYQVYNGDTFSVDGVNSGSQSYWINSSGTYSLYFESVPFSNCADINGTVTFNSGAN